MAILITSISAVSVAFSNETSTSEKVPSNYSECLREDENHRIATEFYCDYRVATDKTNNQQTRLFLQCLSEYPHHKELADSNCQYVANEGNLVVPTILSCRKKDGTNYYLGVFDDRPCVLRFYNAKYLFPDDFQECRSHGGLVSGRFVGGPVCSIVIELCHDDYAGNYCPEVHNDLEAEILLNKCIELGGYYDKKLGVIPECQLTFEEK